MKKHIIAGVICAMVFCCVSCATAETQPESAQQQDEGSSKEVVVKGTLKIKIETEKPDIDVKTDPNEVANSVVATEQGFLGLAPADVKAARTGLPDVISEKRADYSADLSFLEETPIFRISPKMPAGIEIERWNFKVTDPTGTAVKTLKGEGNLPNEIIWDGFDQEGRIMKLSAPYLYTLTYMDKAGNPGSTRRQTPKQVEAIKYFRENKLILEYSEKLIFEPKRKERLSDSGKIVIKEIMDYIKMSNKYPVEIFVYAEDAGLAGDQIQTLQLIFEKELKLPMKFFSMKGIKDNSIPKNYRLVFAIQN